MALQLTANSHAIGPTKSADSLTSNTSAVILQQLSTCLDHALQMLNNRLLAVATAAAAAPIPTYLHYNGVDLTRPLLCDSN